MLIQAAESNYKNKYALNKEISNGTLSFISAVHGHCIFKTVWTLLLGERLSGHPESLNNLGKYAVSVVKREGIVGHRKRAGKHLLAWLVAYVRVTLPPSRSGGRADRQLLA